MIVIIYSLDVCQFFYSDRYKMNEITRKRGRPRILDRENGLSVAAKLFWTHGYEGTSIADLTSAMKITAPSLYATFGSKEELYRQALDYHIDQVTKRRLEVLQQDGLSAYEAVKFYLYDAAASMTAPDKPRGCMISTAVLQHAKENETVAKNVATRRDGAIHLMKSRLDRAVIEEELPLNTDTESLARFYLAIVQGMSAQACDGACEQRLKSLIEIALNAWPNQ